MRPFGFLFLTGAVAIAFACLPRKNSQEKASPSPGPEPLGTADFIEFGGKPTKLSPEEDSIYAQPGACVMVNVYVMDAEEFYVATEKETMVNMVALPTNVAFFSNPACTESAKNFSLAKGESSGGAFVSAPATGATKITFSDATPGGLESTSTTIQSATVTQLGSQGAGIPLVIDECAPQSVIAQDGEGHPVILAKEATITATTTSPSGKFYIDDECTKEGNSLRLRAGESESESIFYKDKTVGAPSLTFSTGSNSTWKKAAISITVSKDSVVTP
jgi:hypothetical protein